MRQDHDYSSMTNHGLFDGIENQTQPTVSRHEKHQRGQHPAVAEQALE